MTDLLPPIRAAQEALYQAEGYAKSCEPELAQYMVWQAKQFLKGINFPMRRRKRGDTVRWEWDPNRRPSIRGKAATRAGSAQ